MTSTPQDLDDLEFDDVRVEPRAHRLLKAGVEVPLEPKAFAVLLALIARHDELVTRDALLDSVWGHRHVTPAVLNRVIAMLRRAIGDDADAPRVIQTVHGLGYRFSADLRRGVAPPTALGTTRDAVEVQAPTPSQPVHNAQPRRAARPVVWLVLLAIAGIVTWIAWPRGEAPKTASDATPVARDEPAAAAPATVVVLPFAVREPGEAETALAVGLAESLDEMLARLPDVRMIGRESAQIALERAKTPRAAGELLQADFVLHGTLDVLTGGGIAVDLELTRIRDGAPAWTSAFQQPRDQLFRILGPTLDGVQRILRPSVPAIGDPLTKASESAQDLYWMARQIAEGTEPDHRQRAIALLERAVERDPHFALAYCHAASNWRLLAAQGAVGLDEGIARAQAAVARALEIDPRLVCALVESALTYTTQWRTPQALPLVRRALELAPDDSRVLALAGNVASYQGRPREGLELHERAQRADPLSRVLRTLVWYDLMMMGRFDEAEGSMQRLQADDESRTPIVQTFGIRAGMPLFGIRTLVASGRYADAIARGAVVDLTRGADIYGVVTLAQAYTQIGLVEEAESTLVGVDQTRSNNPLFGDVRMSLFWRARRFDEARAWIEGGGAGAVQQPWRSSWRAQARALTGDPAGAAADYEAAFERDIDRETVAHSWYTIRFGIGQLANWAVLRRERGLDATPAVEAYAERLRAMVDGGTDLAAIDYCRAVESALRGDHDAAGDHLARALERGWRDAIAFDTDLVWREHAQATWLQPHRRALAQALAAERAKYDAR